MNDIPNTEAYMALAGTVFGGAGLKLFESLLGRGSRRDSEATQLRKELREELTALRAEMDKLKQETDRAEAQVDKWRSRYFRLLAAVATNDQDYFHKVLTERIE